MVAGALLGAALVGDTRAGLVVAGAVLGLGSSLVLPPPGQVLRAHGEGRRLVLPFAGHFVPLRGRHVRHTLVGGHLRRLLLKALDTPTTWSPTSRTTADL